MKKRSALFVITFFIFTSLSQAQVPELINDPAFRSDAQTAVDSIYNFNFAAAEKKLQPWKKQYPKHPLWMLMDGIELWWQVLSDLENTSHDQEFFYKMKRVDYEASQVLRKQSSHVDALIIKAVSNGYIGRQYANRDEWLTSMSQARKALSAYDYLLEVEPDLADLKLAEGMKLYYSAYLPEAYPIVKTLSWFLPDGDKEKGLEYMRSAAQDAVFARAEASYFLGYINYNYEHNYSKALSYFRGLYESYPNNSYYVRYYVRVLFKLKKHGQALEVIDNALQRWQEDGLAFEGVLKEELLTWKGEILTDKNKTDEAIKSLQEAFEIGFDLPASVNRSYHVISGYLLGKLLYEGGKSAEARKVLTHVTDCKARPEYRERAESLLSTIPQK